MVRMPTATFGNENMMVYGRITHLNDPLDRRIGSNVVAARERLGLSITETAERIGVAASVLADIEKGALCPTGQELYSLCRVLNVRPSILLQP